MEIDELKAGPELDLLIADKIMNWDHRHRYRECEDSWYSHCLTCYAAERDKSEEEFRSEPCSRPPHYSEDIAAAWDVVGELGKRGFRVKISVDYDGDCDEVFLAAGDPNCPYQKPYDIRDGHGFTMIEHEPLDVQTVPLAICRAALKAIEALKS